MITLTNIALLYAAMIAVVLAHEIGHLPTSFKINIGLFRIPSTGGIRMRLLPMPEASAMRSDLRYGGLGMNLLILYLVYHFKPEMLFLQLVGLVSFFHFILYTILGSFNRELNESFVQQHPSVLNWWVFDDIENRYWFISVPLGILVFILFNSYYLPILLNLFA